MEKKDLDELSNLAKKYYNAKNESDKLAKTVSDLRNQIINKLGKLKTLKTESHLIELIDGHRESLNKDSILKKLKELKIDVDPKWFKISDYVTLKVTTLEDIVSNSNNDNDPNRVKISLDDLKI